jgi:hypothetical protein
MTLSRRLRLIRRLRSVRRRTLQPLLDRLRRRAAAVWTEPARRSVAWQLTRLARAVEGATLASGRLAAAEDRLAREVDRLANLPRPRPAPGAGWSPPQTPTTVVPALAVAAAAALLAAGNTFLVERYLLPPVAALELPGTELVGGFWLAGLFSTLALLLGLFHYALHTVGRSLGLRLLGVAAALLLVAQGVLQGGATVVAVEAWVGDVTGSWAGLAAVSMLAGSAGLLPPVIGALSHATVERFARWSDTADQRLAAQAAVAQERLTSRVDRSLREVAAGLAAVRHEAAGVPEGDVSRLLIRPHPAPTLERLATLLRRMGDTVERDPAQGLATPSALALRHLLALGALLAWVLAAAGAVALGAPAASAALEAGQSGLVAAGSLTALVALLLGGLALRLIMDRPGAHLPMPATFMALLLLVVAAGCTAMALGPFAAGVGPVPADPLTAAAVLNLLVLAAALPSAFLPEGVLTAGSLLQFSALALARTALRTADLAAAAADRALGGRPRPLSRTLRRPPVAPREPALATRPAVGALGSGPDRW